LERQEKDIDGPVFDVAFSAGAGYGVWEESAACTVVTYTFPRIAAPVFIRGNAVSPTLGQRGDEKTR
jgi:hypothetical protein